ncbi:MULTISPECIES: MFS transporter [Streptomyces]|uniref:MFS transporter n=1 Tax=Streptomyces TaxID=1883 RepID=UPI00211D3476|nr:MULTISPECIES: MFS transporter [Streptomyces]MCX4485518.1 MFS transporter [Streptomyces anulatus]WSI78437.1 MFS transporter [Streptomyces anulatus]WSU74435.1 MFS transporter [Streptomyces anulatus]WTD10697.1 MFS transporter [Streptomyces anulatus]WTE04004.1 MFS transporter [Streptomyces anulatus]
MAQLTTTSPTPAPRAREPRFHRAWVIAVVAGAAIVTAGAFTTVPGLLVTPLHENYAWDRGQIALAASVNMILFGLTAPFAAALMDRVGIRRVVVGALLLVSAGALLTSFMSQPWQLVAYWGVLIGLGSGCLTMTFAASITADWFDKRRGLVTGALSSSSHLGQLIFLPLLAWSVDRFDWRPPVVTLAFVALAVAALVFLLLRDHPADVGAKPYGATEFVPKPARVPGAARRTIAVLVAALRTGPFWLLAGMFVICGASTNGIMWSNWAPAAHDHGMAVTAAASMLSLIGIFSALGAIFSGWLTDRFDPRRLLTVYFAIRALTLLALPLVFTSTVTVLMIAFVVVYGLVDVATVPPVIELSRRVYGEDGPIVFGWANSAHQLGAGASAFLGATARDLFGTYDVVWTALSVACVVAALMALVVRAPRPA